MALAVIQKGSNYGYQNHQYSTLRDFSEPLITQKDTTSYSERVLSTIDFGEMVPPIWDLNRKETAYIKMFRQMAKNPYVSFSITDILSEMLAYEDDTVYPVKLDLSNIKGLSKNIQNKIHEEFDYILKKLSFHKKAWTYLYNFYVDGKILFYINRNKKIGITDIIELDPVRTKRFMELDENGKEKINYIYMDTDLAQTLFQIPEDNIVEVNSGVMDDQGMVWVSHLYKAYIPLNQLCSIEDALVIYRISRAPQRRVFYVDVGELPKSKAEAYMKELIRNYRNKMTYDKETGTIKEQVNHMSLLDDVWLPRRSGSQGTSVDTLQGNTSFLQNLDDLEYFLRKLFHSLEVPFSRFTDDENRAMLGRATEINRDELKYSKFINRLRSQFNTLFFTLMMAHLSDKNIISKAEFEQYREDIIFQWNTDTLFSEFKRLDVIEERLNMLDKVWSQVGRLYSLNYVRHEILGFNDEEIENMKKEIESEKDEYIQMGIYPPEQNDNYGGYGNNYGSYNNEFKSYPDKKPETISNIPDKPDVD